MFGELTRNWGAFVARGIIAILFGLAGFFMPGITLAALVVLFGVYVFFDGFFAIIAAVRGQSGETWWALVLRGVLSLAAAAVTFFYPGITALALVFIIAAWAIAGGIVEITTAIRLRKIVKGEWLLGLAGALTILFGVLLAANPGAGALALLWLICGYAIVVGILFIALGFRLRSVQRSFERTTTGKDTHDRWGEQKAAD